MNNTLPYTIVSNSFVDSKINAIRFGGLVGELVSTNESEENDALIEHCYYTQGKKLTYTTNGNIEVKNTVATAKGESFKDFNVREYSSKLLLEANAWTNYRSY